MVAEYCRGCDFMLICLVKKASFWMSQLVLCRECKGLFVETFPLTLTPIKINCKRGHWSGAISTMTCKSHGGNNENK